MFEFNVIFVFSVYLYLSIVFECESVLPKNPCHIRLKNGQARLQLVRGVTVAKITCNQPYVLVNGNETMTCVGGKWDGELPICSKYDPIHLTCNFESPEERFCGWKNYMYNEIDWLADKMPVLPNSNRSHAIPGSSQYFSNYYISLDMRDYGSTTTGQLLSPSLLPVATKQRCLKFSYKVMPGDSHSRPTLKVIFGGIPHWETHEGKGRVIIGLYRFNVSNKIVIEGSSCKAAIDNLIITEDNSCTQRPYDEEIYSCHDNCGKISDGVSCSCDWSCHNNNNCCPDIQIKCPYIKPVDDIARLYLTNATPNKVLTTVKNNNMYNFTCTFESDVATFCGWKNDISNYANWSVDHVSSFFSKHNHVMPGSFNYFSSNYISLDAGNGNNGSIITSRLISPPIPAVRSNQRCLIFAYRVMSGNSNDIPTLKVTFGRIPHWETHEGEGRAIIGLYRFNISSSVTSIVIEGKSCKAAIDNLIITEGNSCNKQPYVEKINSCHDNCGKISNGVGCSCDWSCYKNNNCCPDIQIKCPYIKSMDEIVRLYLTTTTSTTPTIITTSEKNKMLHFTIPKHEDKKTIQIDKLTLFFGSTVLRHQTPTNSKATGPTSNPTLKGLTRRSLNIVNHLNSNISTFSDKNLTGLNQPDSENSVIPLQHNQTLKTNAFSLNNYSGLSTIATESTNLLENLNVNKITGFSSIYDAIYIIGYLVAVGVILFIVKHSFYLIKSFIKKPTDAKDQAFVETKNEGSRNIELTSNLQ